MKTLDKTICIDANQAYEAWNFPEVRNLLDYPKIKALPCALHNKAYYCYSSSEMEPEHAYDTAYVRNLLWEVLRLDPASLKTYLLLGKIDLDEKEYVSAATMFQKALELQDNPVAWNNLGVAYSLQNSGIPVTNYFRKAWEISHNPVVCYNYALASVKEGTEKLQTILALLPANDEIDRIDIGRLFFLTGDYETVVECYDALWADTFPSVRDYGIYLYALNMQGQTERAQEVRQNAVSLLQGYREDAESADAAAAWSNHLLEITRISEQIAKGQKPSAEQFPRAVDSCYLYHCVIHSDSENIL